MRARLRRWIGRLLGLVGGWLLLSGPALAADCTSAAAVRTGETATCDGILTPSPWVARCLTCLRVDLPTCRAEATAAVSLGRTDLDACRAGRRAAEALAEERLRMLREATKIEPEPLPWWRSPWLWSGVGLVVGGVAGWRIAR